MLKNIYKNVYSLPALIMHELSHIIVALLLGGKLKEINIKSACSVELRISNLKSLTKVRLVSISPLLIPLIFIAISFFNNYFIIALIYSISTYKATLPSKTDILTAKF